MTLAQKVPLKPIDGVGNYQSAGTLADPGGVLEKILSNTVGFITVIAGLAFIIYVILAGLTWITARDESERVSRAKQMFTNALVGLAIVVIAWAFTGMMETVFGFRILSPSELIKTMMPNNNAPEISNEALRQFYGE